MHENAQKSPTTNMPGVTGIHAAIATHAANHSTSALTQPQTSSSAIRSKILQFGGPIYRISYDLAYDHRKFIVRSTYYSDLKRVEISLRNIVR